MGNTKINQQGYDLNAFRQMKAQQQAEIMSLRINLAKNYFGELVKPNAERTRDAIAAAKDSDEKIEVDFSLEAMLARQLADTFLIAMGLVEPPQSEQSEANGEAAKPSPILTP